MIGIKYYKIECRKCKNVSRIKIKNEEFVEYVDILPIISSRKRTDLKWGFECVCGNDTRLSKQELKNPSDFIKGDIQGVIDRLNLTEEDGFNMMEQK